MLLLTKPKTFFIWCLIWTFKILFNEIVLWLTKKIKKEIVLWWLFLETWGIFFFPNQFHDETPICCVLKMINLLSRFFWLTKEGLNQLTKLYGTQSTLTPYLYTTHILKPTRDIQLRVWIDRFILIQILYVSWNFLGLFFFVKNTHIIKQKQS